MTLPEIRQVQCQAFLADCGRRFTNGKVYEARHFKNALFEITDDLGHTRYIIPDEPCPHLPPSHGQPFRSDQLGRFITVHPDSNS